MSSHKQDAVAVVCHRCGFPSLRWYTDEHGHRHGDCSTCGFRWRRWAQEEEGRVTHQGHAKRVKDEG